MVLYELTDKGLVILVVSVFPILFYHLTEIRVMNYVCSEFLKIHELINCSEVNLSRIIKLTPKPRTLESDFVFCMYTTLYF